VSGPVVAVLVCLAGGVGAALRLLLDGLIRDRVPASYPVGTTVINVSGSFLLGLVVGLAGSHLLPPAGQLVCGTGLLGGYTTFSTASVETVRLAEDRRYLAAAANAVGVLVAATGAAALGLLAAWGLGG
jgi:fluoride exporter